MLRDHVDKKTFLINFIISIRLNNHWLVILRIFRNTFFYFFFYKLFQNSKKKEKILCILFTTNYFLIISKILFLLIFFKTRFACCFLLWKMIQKLQLYSQQLQACKLRKKKFFYQRLQISRDKRKTLIKKKFMALGDFQLHEKNNSTTTMTTNTTIKKELLKMEPSQITICF